MKAKTRLNKKMMIAGALALALCLALGLYLYLARRPDAGSGTPEVAGIIGGSEWDLDAVYAAPDGQWLLTGRQEGCRAAVICLGKDRTKRWEYMEPEDAGYTEYHAAAVLEDGTVAVVRENKPDDGALQYTAAFFTPDGKPAGKETVLFTGEINECRATASWILIRDRDWKTFLVDWDGNAVARQEDTDPGDPVWSDGGLALFSQEAQGNHQAKIVKMDVLRNQVLWETTLDRQWPEMEKGVVYGAEQTEDGGYVVLLREGKRGAEDTWEWKETLVKVDPEGKVRWTCRECPGDGMVVRGLCEYRGKIAVCFAPDDPDTDNPVCFLWLDRNGRKLGTREVTLDPAVLFSGDRPYHPEAESQSAMSVEKLIPMEDGVWALTYGNIWEMDDETVTYMPVARNNYVLFRIPEL